MGKILITGGAGFVGSHLADELLSQGYEVRVLDNLSRQVHPQDRRPDYLSRELELIVGDVCDRGAVRNAMKGVSSVFHLAASVGVGQSMYEIENYTKANCLGTATLLEEIVQRPEPIQCLVVASSMSIYGEGLYQSPDGTLIESGERSLEQLRTHCWEVQGENGAPLKAVPTPETKRPALSSVYAISKYHQERMCMTVGKAYGIPTTALRFFNIYGRRQSLSNPYTGVLAIFASRLLNHRAPVINEDGHQKRDFVSVYDVARACRLAMETAQAQGKVFNIGSGDSCSVLEIANLLAKVLGKGAVQPEIPGRYRIGDIRNCFADISLARSVLGYEPQISLTEGLCDLAEWLPTQEAEDHLQEASRELEKRGLTV
jgi:dTDP-L-rhamnose 4-epimerase